MDRRTLLALVLTAIVIVMTPLLFPSARPARTPQPDTVSVAARDYATPAMPGQAPDRGAAPVASLARPGAARPAQPARADTIVVTTNRAVFRVSSLGGTPESVEMPEYKSLRPDAVKGTPVRLLANGDRLMHFKIATVRDTLDVDSVAFIPSAPRREGDHTVLDLRSASSAIPVALSYRFSSDSFVTTVTGAVTAPGWESADLLVRFPRAIRSDEANVQDDVRHLAFGFKSGRSDAKSVSFRDLDSLLVHVDTGAIRWAAERNKYFVVAMTPAGPTAADTSFKALLVRGRSRVNGEALTADATTVMPVRGGKFALRVYAGPQSWEHLRATAPDLENVNPYGGWLHVVVQPFATIVMRLILWLRSTTKLGYGWVLVIFGVLVRLLLWPLNQNAMRSSMKLQRIQPELQELQKRYRNDPEKQRDAMMRLYQEHGMSPFTPVLGCLPMLLPMPILFALYFVFQNTIELRGVSFLWMPDLSLRDPYFITPIFMGISMFVLSWIGMRGMPPNPQGKMMSYVMPVMFTVLFWNFAAGLNLYYAVQNVAALPQQWLLAHERQSRGGANGNGSATRPAAPGSKGARSG